MEGLIARSAASATATTQPSTTSDARPSGSVQLPTSSVAFGSPVVRLRT
jgi:hypothetical protein